MLDYVKVWPLNETCGYGHVHSSYALYGLVFTMNHFDVYQISLVNSKSFPCQSNILYYYYYYYYYYFISSIAAKVQLGMSKIINTQQ
jgi:hypothetical protein